MDKQKLNELANSYANQIAGSTNKSNKILEINNFINQNYPKDSLELRQAISTNLKSFNFRGDISKLLELIEDAKQSAKPQKDNTQDDINNTTSTDS